MTISSELIQPAYGDLKIFMNQIFWSVMAAELVMKILLNPKHIFQKPWTYMEMGILGLAFIIPGILVVFVFRFIIYLYTFVDYPLINRVIHTFMHSLPSLIVSSSVLCVCVFGYGLLANTLLGKDFPLLFGSLSRSLTSFVQIMTFDDWVERVFKPVTEVYPFAGIIFMSFIVIIVFGVLNIFVGSVIHAMSAVGEQPDDDVAAIKALKKEISDLKKLIQRQYENNPKP